MVEQQETPNAYPGVPLFEKDKPGYGVKPDGSLFLNETGDDGKLRSHWISDGYARISEEMRRENGDAIFIIEGRGAKDGHTFKFEMDAFGFADGRKLKGKLTAQFGAINQVGGLKSDVIQQLSHDVKRFRLIETPQWIGGKAAVQGLDLLPNLRYVSNHWVPVNVAGGDLSDAQQSLRDLLPSWDPKLTTVALTTVLGSPLVARWRPGDRFGLGLRGTTGVGKTEFIKNAMAIYGQGYLVEDNLMKWGEKGSTTNALMKVAATSGFLPFLTDNYKPLKKDDESNLVGLIQAILEGSDKARLTSDSEFKESLKFACTPLITGEDFPMESSTMARCIVLDWSPIHSPARLTNAQGLAHNLPALGREWLKWLSENSSTVELIFKDFETSRTELYKELVVSSDAVNPGRLSSNITLLRLTWKVALKCPVLAEVLTEFNDAFEEGMDYLTRSAPEETTAANEAEDFVDTLTEIIGSGRAKLVSDGTDITGVKDVVGWIRNDGEVCIFPKTARNLTNMVSPIMQKLSSSSLYRQLDERGYIKTKKENEEGIERTERTLVRWFNGKSCKVLVFNRGIINLRDQ
jgi:hypothetical protein